jgi:AcrR family transcriptional regulator
MAGARRVGSKTSATRLRVLDIAERLMLDEGYAAVTTRGVAAKAGLKSPLVHYYFPTTDDLLLALFRVTAERAHKRTIKAVTSARPLESLWNLSKDPAHTALSIEQVALANHNPMIRRKSAVEYGRYRTLQAEALEKALNGKLDDTVFAPVVAIMLIQGIARILVMERALGVTVGHNETRGFVDWLLQQVRLDRRGGDAQPSARRRRTKKVAPR